MTSTALAIRGDQGMFDDYQRAVLKQLGIGDDVHNAELASYLHICQRTGLDPFSGQIHLIGRYDKKAGRAVYRPQTGIDGYRVIAQRTCERTGGALGYQDTLWCGKDGVWSSVWLSSEPPAAAKVTVLRNGQPFPAVAHYAEYVPTDREGRVVGMWQRMAAGQLAKCAEALALRKAFPNDMAGVYTAEEMEQADSQPHLTAVQQHDAERDAAGLMTTHQRVEHARLRRMNEPPPGAVEKLPGTPEDDPWLTPETPAAEATAPHPPPDTAPHRNQAGKAALDKLNDAVRRLAIDDDDQPSVIAWLIGKDWTASVRQVSDLTKQLNDFIDDKRAQGDLEEARSLFWQAFHKRPGAVTGDADE